MAKKTLTVDREYIVDAHVFCGESWWVYLQTQVGGYECHRETIAKCYTKEIAEKIAKGLNEAEGL